MFPKFEFRIQFILLAVGLAFLGGCEQVEQGSPEPKAVSWLNFLETKGVGDEAILPDFSFAGYDYSESPIPTIDGPLFEVSEFGAVPNDGVLDLLAVQQAIDAAAKAGGGVVQFGKGRYDMNTIDGEETQLRVESSNIVLRGVGSGADGTELFWPRNLEPEFPEKMYSTPFMVEIAPRSIVETGLTQITQGAVRGEYTISVADSSQISPGDWISLRLGDPKAIKLFFGERLPRREWTRSWEDGVLVMERHQVVSVEGKTIRFREPLQVDVDVSNDWEVMTYPSLEEIGIEGVRFSGAWKGDFVHHRSAFDDGGWSAVEIKHVRNGWIRDVEFKDWNYALKMGGCSAFSVLRTRLTGTLGHHGIHVRGGYGVLVGLSSDEAEHFHGPGVGYQSASTVYWRYDYGAQSSFDAHSTFPYATLLDACSGGWRYGRSGGPLAGMPNHMKGLVVWNFERTGGEESEFDFWRDGGRDDRDLFVDPVFVGFHGIETSFFEEHMGVVESLGVPVSPASLFEAQLELRTGSFPTFLRDEMRVWEEEVGRK